MFRLAWYVLILACRKLGHDLNTVIIKKENNWALEYQGKQLLAEEKLYGEYLDISQYPWPSELCKHPAHLKQNQDALPEALIAFQGLCL